MNKFFIDKPFDNDKFLQYLQPAQNSGQYTNYGASVQLLEVRARKMLGIDITKAVIATVNGAAALQAILLAIQKIDGYLPVYTQDFTFPCNKQGEAFNAIITDITEDEQMVLPVVAGKSVIIVTNCFGHLQNINKIQKYAKDNNCIVVYDNAATPYSMWEDSNSCNFGVASFISLHHTKPIGFGEGGLVIIDKSYEAAARSAINFGKEENSFSKLGSNYKMSELSASAILQWWDSFDIQELASTYKYNYYSQLSRYKKHGRHFTHHGTTEFFPNCLPLIKHEKVSLDIFKQEDYMKYYKPLEGLQQASYIYNNIVCLPLAS